MHLLVLLLWLELFRANSELATTVSHQFTQLMNAQIAHFVHPYQNGCAHWQAAMADLAQDRRGDFKRARDNAASFFRLSFSIKVSSNLSGS